MNNGVQKDSPGRGIALMLAGMLLLTLNDATAKWLSTDYPVPQIISLRGLFILLPLTLILYMRGGISAFKPGRISNQALRAFCFVGSTFFIITALSLMPLAVTIALTFTGPLMVAALAAVFLDEQVGWRRWSAIIIGFIGIIVMIKPTEGVFQWAALIALAAAFWGALRDVVTRKIRFEESSDLILFYSTLTVAIVGLFGAFIFPWQSPNSTDLFLFAMLGILNGGAHYLMIEAHRWAEASIVAPFRYSALLWAMILGLIIWGDIPGFWLLSGSTLVIGSGLYILQQETRNTGGSHLLKK